MHLQRFTTEYSVVEDRLSLIGEAGPDRTVMLWLTQRLMTRLLPAVVSWLEKRGEARNPSVIACDADTLQAFAQHVALAAHQPQTPVQADGATRQMLVEAVDLASDGEYLALTFRGATAPAVMLTLPAQALRQWLGIVHAACTRGGWLQLNWPAWLGRSPEVPATARFH